MYLVIITEWHFLQYGTKIMKIRYRMAKIRLILRANMAFPMGKFAFLADFFCFLADIF